MFPHAYFQSSYFAPRYWNPVLEQTASPAAAAATWAAVTPTYSLSGETLSPAAATASWLAGAFTWVAGTATLAPVAATANWLLGASDFLRKRLPALGAYIRRRRR